MTSRSASASETRPTLRSRRYAESLFRRDDAVAGFLAEVAKEDPDLLRPWSPAEEKRLLRVKIDPIVMTLSQFCLMSMLFLARSDLRLLRLTVGAVDKVCIGTAATLGMRSDLGLVGQVCIEVPIRSVRH
jgi:hypothetical protein